MPTAPNPTPAAQVPPVATPTPTPRGRRGHLTFTQQRLAEPLILEQVVLDPTWNWFKTAMVFVGGISVFLIFGTLMFWLGEWRSASASGTSVSVPVAIVQPAIPPAPPPPVQQNTAPQPQWNSFADCQRHYVLTLGQDPEGACDSLK